MSRNNLSNLKFCMDGEPFEEGQEYFTPKPNDAVMQYIAKLQYLKTLEQQPQQAEPIDPQLDELVRTRPIFELIDTYGWKAVNESMDRQYPPATVKCFGYDVPKYLFLK